MRKKKAFNADMSILTPVVNEGLIDGLQLQNSKLLFLYLLCYFTLLLLVLAESPSGCWSCWSCLGFFPSHSVRPLSLWLQLPSRLFFWGLFPDH